MEPKVTTRQQRRSEGCRVAMSVMVGGSDDLADWAVEWLLSDSLNFEVHVFERQQRQDPATELIRHFSGTCSSGIYRELEGALLNYYPEDEWKNHRRRSERSRENLRPGLTTLNLARSDYWSAQTGDLEHWMQPFALF